MSLVFIMNEFMKGQKGILGIIQVLTSILLALFMIITYFIIKRGENTENVNTENVNTEGANNTN